MCWVSHVHLLVELSNIDRLLPTKEVLGKALNVYFRCAHRQPLWLFDDPGELYEDACEELQLVLLSIGVQYEPSNFTEPTILPARAYNDAAQGMIMLKIANGSIHLRSLQSLCLLAFSNMVGESGLLK